MEIDEIVLKLTGPICAVGESHTDRKRMENLKTLTGVIDKLLFEVYRASSTADRQEYSMKEIGQYAKRFICPLQLTS